MREEFSVSDFEYFYSSCVLTKKTTNPKTRKYLDRIKYTIASTNKIDANTNEIYNEKVKRKENKIYKILTKINKSDKEFLLNFNKEYSYENNIKILEDDSNIIARNLAKSFYDEYVITNNKSIYVKVYLNNKEKIKIEDRYDGEDLSVYFLKELEKNNKFKKYVDRINKLGKSKNSTKLDRINHEIDKIFDRGSSYPDRNYFINVIQKIITLFDLKERELKDIKKVIQNSFKDSSVVSKNKKNKKNYGYVIPKTNSIDEIIEINDLLSEEYDNLVRKEKSGKEILFDIPYSNNLQKEKVEIINSYFDPRFKFELNHDSTDIDFMNEIINISELADDIASHMFKETLFEAHNSSDVLNHSNNYENLHTLYYLYSSKDRIKKYEKLYKKFMNAYDNLLESRKEAINKLSRSEKEKRFLFDDEIIPNVDYIMNSLSNSEGKFLDAHAVEECKYKAINKGKYLNYDLEIIAKDMKIDDLAFIYNKLKRNVIYTSFIDDLKVTDNREEKYKEARFIQNETLEVLQESIAKTIINKTYKRTDEISYDEYQSMLNSIYVNILHEKRLSYTRDNIISDSEYENDYQEVKKEWDEQSEFVKALYLIVSKEE